MGGMETGEEVREGVDCRRFQKDVVSLCVQLA